MTLSLRIETFPGLCLVIELFRTIIWWVQSSLKKTPFVCVVCKKGRVTGNMHLQNVLFHSFCRLFELHSLNFLKSPLPHLLNPPNRLCGLKKLLPMKTPAWVSGTCVIGMHVLYLIFLRHKHDQWTYYLSAFFPWQWFTRGPWHTFCLNYRSLSAKSPGLCQHCLRLEDLKSSGLDICVRHPRPSSSVLLPSPLMVLHHHFSHDLALLLRGNFEQVIDKQHRK